jgi:hypothetical protein
LAPAEFSHHCSISKIKTVRSETLKSYFDAQFRPNIFNKPQMTGKTVVNEPGPEINNSKSILN